MAGSSLEKSTIANGRAAGRTLRVLLVDEDPAGRQRVREALVHAGGEMETLEADSPAEVRDILSSEKVDVVVSELSHTVDHELDVLHAVRAAAPEVPVVIVTDRGSEHWATEAMKGAAADYLAKASTSPELWCERIYQAITRSPRFSRNGHAVTQPSNADAYRRVLNALPVRLAVLDPHGVIRAVNDAWRKAAYETYYQSAQHTAGVDFLEICDTAVAQHRDKAETIAHGLRNVLRGDSPPFYTEYRSEEHGTTKWYKLSASPLFDPRKHGAMIMMVDITDRKRAEEERDQLTDQSMRLLCIGGFDGYMKRWNPNVQRVLGHTEQDAMSHRLIELVHPDDRDRMAQMGMRLRQGEHVVGVETRVRTRDGDYKEILWEAVPNVDKGIWFANGQDITDRKRAEQQLRESHQRFQLIASASNEAFWDWDLRENRLWQNDAYLETFGTFDSDRETVVEWWRRRVHPDDRERILAEIPRTAVDGQQKWVFEYRLQRRDGTYADVYDRGFVIFDDDAQPVRMVGSIIDVTQLKRAEARLRESEERFRLAAQATHDAIWDWDLKRDFVWRSKAFKSVFGYGAEEISPDLDWWVERLHPDDRARVLSQIPSADGSGSRQCAFEYRFRRADGSYADVFDRGFVMSDPDGTPTRMVGSMMDISERRRAEDLARLHQAELAHYARLNTMGEIATGIAHELNQPLTAISNYAESCVRAIGTPGGDDKLREWIEKIATNTHRAAEMIRGLRSFTRKAEPCRADVEIGGLIQEVLDLLETETRWKNVRIAWDRGPEVIVAADRIQVQQVLVNLLSNACDAMAGNDADDRRVTISVRPSREQVQISVEDCGEGIAHDELERVFDAFFTSKREGVGIGLAISRSIVEDHGGRLWVRPNPGRGVTFSFSLPRAGA
ncbi:MAG: PAS domain S-box protein [Planctomycetota bacterium]|nr:MAG: PAS domain S-box protein [Planctomycetota bacterium]